MSAENHFYFTPEIIDFRRQGDKKGAIETNYLLLLLKPQAILIMLR
jgi:hypothetical protein